MRMSNDQRRLKYQPEVVKALKELSQFTTGKQFDYQVGILAGRFRAWFHKDEKEGNVLCDEWKRHPAKAMEWLMTGRESVKWDGIRIHRRNPTKPYSPDNIIFMGEME